MQYIFIKRQGDDNIINFYDELLKEFKIIADKKGVKGVNNLTSAAGLTFEKLLGKKPDSLYLPDYYGIEIKTTQRYSRYAVSLFSLSFDGPNLFEMNRLMEKYSIDCQLYGSIYTKKYSLINGVNFKLKVDKKLKRLVLCVYDLYFNLIEERTYIDFSSIKIRLETKLTKLALVYASKKLINDEKYFRYYKITFYELKSFDKFIELLEEEKIKVSILGRTAKSGIDAGKQKNKNLIFAIQKDSIEELFEKKYEYDADLN